MAVGLPAAATLGLVLAATTAVPVDEIAQVLARRQIDPPAAEVVSGLTWAEFEPIVLRRDPYARYLGPADYAGFRAGVGSRIGVGLHLSEAGAGWLVHPIPDGPAWRAGLRADARLLSVDGDGVNGHGRDWLTERLNGPEGDEVLLVVDTEHAGQQAIRVRRQPFTPPSVSYVEEDGLAYIRLWDFRRRETLAALRRGIERLSSSNAPLIIDLRHASGGDLFEALDSTSLFLSAGLSLAMIEDNRGERREFHSLSGRITQRSVLLLVGPGTASAASPSPWPCIITALPCWWANAPTASA